MMEDITGYCTDLLLQQSSPVTLYRYKVDQGHDAKSDFRRFEFIKSMVDSDNFQEAIRKIKANPVIKWRYYEDNVHIQNVRRFSGHEMRQLASTSNRVHVEDERLRKYLASIPLKENFHRRTHWMKTDL